MANSGVQLENMPALTMTPLETRFASLSGNWRASQLPRRFVLCCAVACCISTVDGPLVNQANSCHSLERNHTWCRWDAPTIVDRCVVEDTEETKEHKRVLTPFSCWRLWACCTPATSSHHVLHNLGKSPQCWEGPVSLSNSLGTMEPVCGRGIEETSGTPWKWWTSLST